MVKIQNLIAAIVPDIYCDPSKRAKVKQILKDNKGYAAAAEAADLIAQDDLFTVEIAKQKPLDARGLKSPFEKHRLVYDSPSESLEPLYFWILDFVNGMFQDNVIKLTDNFVASPGSGYFSELGQKATRMQEEASKMLGAVNQVLKSILNILYDLKEFTVRLDAYDKYSKGTSEEKRAALLSLKQIWLDNVDIKRGNTSIKGMASQFDYVTLIDAFMASKNLEDVTKSPDEGGLDLNDRVRRILQQRLSEFDKWRADSEVELRKRFEIEKRYLRSQYNTIQLYSRWIRPYLEAAKRLEQDKGLAANAALVNTFNTIMLDLTLLAFRDYKASGDVATGDLPELFLNFKGRKYRSVVLIEFKFRGIPQRLGQGYTFGGRTEMIFSSYGLREDEFELLKKEVDKDGFEDILKLITGATTESLDEMKKEIYSFLEIKENEKQKIEIEEDINPFTSLFSFFKSKEVKKDEKKVTGPDNLYERVLRSQAIIEARDNCKTLYETFKKAQRMPSW